MTSAEVSIRHYSILDVNKGGTIKCGGHCDKSGCQTSGQPGGHIFGSKVSFHWSDSVGNEGLGFSCSAPSLLGQLTVSSFLCRKRTVSHRCTRFRIYTLLSPVVLQGEKIWQTFACRHLAVWSEIILTPSTETEI